MGLKMIAAEVIKKKPLDSEYIMKRGPVVFDGEFNGGILGKGKSQ